MIGIVHVLLTSFLSSKPASTRITLVAWSVMIQGIHVLLGCSFTAEDSITCFTLMFIVVRHRWLLEPGESRTMSSVDEANG